MNKKSNKKIKKNTNNFDKIYKELILDELKPNNDIVLFNNFYKYYLLLYDKNSI
jgi:hypothetical protein